MNQVLTYHPPAWLYGEPPAVCSIRTEPSDFIVREELGYEPEGEGEHQYLYIQKIGENTDWVARQLANFCQVSPKQVAYAGKKDRHAVTEQWFSVHLPGNRRTLTWSLFGGDSIQVLKSSKHRRKIKLGNLKCNSFEIRLRDITDTDSVIARFALIGKGVPNYFGEQRFGRGGGNLVRGQAMLRGEFEERQRNKRGLYISAVRSQIFNEILSERVSLNQLTQLMPGDMLIDPCSQRCERWEPGLEAQAEQIGARKLVPTAPLWGQGDLYSFEQVKALEQRISSAYQQTCDALAQLGLRQERRAALLVPENLALEEEASGQLLIKFSLPAGCFATSVLRELCHWRTRDGERVPEEKAGDRH